MLTSTFNTRFGDVTISIDDGGTSATFKTLGFATIDYEFDITPDETDIDRVSVFYGRFQIEVDNKDSLGNDLYDRLRTNIPSLESVDMEVVVDRDTDWEFEYKVSRQDLELSELTRKVTIKGTADIDNGEVMGDLTRDDPFIYSRFEGLSYEAISVGDFIEDYVGSLNPSLSNVIQRSSGIDANVSDPVYKSFDQDDISSMGGERVLCLLDIDSDDFDDIEDEAIEDTSQFAIAASLAASEGSIFGTGFDRNFWIYRGSTGTPINVDWESTEVLDVDSVELVQAFRDVSVGTRQYYIEPIQSRIPYLGIDTGVHISLQQWNRRMPKRFQFVDTPAVPFLSEGVINATFSFTVITVTAVNSSGTSNVVLGGTLSDDFSVESLNRLATVQNMVNAVNNTTGFSGVWEATLESNVIDGQDIPSCRIDRVGSGDGIGTTVNINGHTDFTYDITPNPTNIAVEGFNANGNAVRDLRRNALSAYTKVFPIGETFKISGVLSIFIKPWETFTFINAPSRYTGKEFRLSSCSYDLFQSKMTFKAYEVG